MNRLQTMTQLTRRRLQTYAPRGRRAVWLLLIPAVASFVAMLLLASKGGVPFFISIAVCVGNLLVAKGVEMFMFRVFHCPECHERLPKPSVVDGQTIKFTCQRCAIEWDTGHQVAESSA